MAEELADRTEAPTPHRRAEARRDGKVARSADLTAGLLCLATLLLLRQYGPGVVDALRLVMAEALGGSATPSTARLGYLVGTSLLPLLVGLALVAVAANVLQGGLLFRVPRNKQALNPAAGFARIFSGRSVAQLALNLLKLVAVVAVVFLTTRGRMNELLSLTSGSESLLYGAGTLAFAIAVRVAVALIVLGVIDYAYQRFRHECELRMTRREVKEELRRQEGDALARQRRRSLARSWTDSQQRRHVAGADVVLTASSDLAVALKFDAATMQAPRLVAKGRGTDAERLRRYAIESRVPVVERDSLAATLSSVVAVGRDVPPHLFAPLADVLAFARVVSGKDQQA